MHPSLTQNLRFLYILSMNSKPLPSLETHYVTSALASVDNPMHSLLTEGTTYASFLELDNDPFFKLELNPATSMKADYALYKSKRQVKKRG